MAKGIQSLPIKKWQRRTGDAVDGCAIFWKANEFSLLEEESIKFKELGLRDNVAQLSVFQEGVQSGVKETACWQYSCSL